MFAVVAQLVERWLPKPKVAGSCPVYRSDYKRLPVEEAFFRLFRLGKPLRKAQRELGRLVLGTEQVIHRLDGIEGGEGNLHEKGVPVTHGAVPQSGKLKSLELTPVLGLA